MIPRDRAFRKTSVAFVPLGGTNIEKYAAQHKDYLGLQNKLKVIVKMSMFRREFSIMRQFSVTFRCYNDR
jgi:hypothetical protein